MRRFGASRDPPLCDGAGLPVSLEVSSADTDDGLMPLIHTIFRRRPAGGRIHASLAAPLRPGRREFGRFDLPQDQTEVADANQRSQSCLQIAGRSCVE